MSRFSSHGGRIDQTAVIGHPPEHRDWRPGDACLSPDIHSTARVEAFVTVDAGWKVRTRVGAGSWLMKHVHIGHDAWIGDNVEIAPHASVGGHVKIGHNVRIGQSAVFKPGVTVGEGARIGCGAVVVKDVPAGEVWAGNPAHRLDVGAGAGRDSVSVGVVEQLASA